MMVAVLLLVVFVTSGYSLIYCGVPASYDDSRECHTSKPIFIHVFDSFCKCKLQLNKAQKSIT